MNIVVEFSEDDREPKMSKKRQRKYAKRYSRRSFTTVEGTELIERNGDVMIGSRENSSIQIVDVQLKVGPLTFIMNKKVAYPFKRSRVAFPPLMARLRLKVRVKFNSMKNSLNFMSFVFVLDFRRAIIVGEVQAQKD
jgi:hypothetical protein